MRRLAVWTALIWFGAYIYANSVTRAIEVEFDMRAICARDSQVLIDQINQLNQQLNKQSDQTSAFAYLDLAQLEESLASVYLAAKKYKEAEPHFRKSLDLTRQYANSTAAKSRRMCRVANFYRDWRDFKTADALFHQALACDQNSLPINRSSVARDCNDLGVLNYVQGEASAVVSERKTRFDAARYWLERAESSVLPFSSKEPRLKSIGQLIKRNLAAVDYELGSPS